MERRRYLPFRHGMTVAPMMGVNDSCPVRGSASPRARGCQMPCFLARQTREIVGGIPFVYFEHIRASERRSTQVSHVSVSLPGIPRHPAFQSNRKPREWRNKELQCLPDVCLSEAWPLLNHCGSKRDLFFHHRQPGSVVSNWAAMM